ncbi:MAG: hypothetical protein JZU47_11010 [Prolixibacteraceae bacterium]|nr:hypothetical protein [Prolixibacteraceae bacterium]
MKKLILFILLLPVFCFAQEEMSSDSLQTANYNDVVSKKVRGKIGSYITKDGEKFSVGDTITIGVSFRNDQFDLIRQYAVIQTYPLDNNASGSPVVIKSLKSYMKNVQVITTKPNGYVYGLWISNFEAALANKEVKSNVMSSDQALTELKRCKDKLDLGLITQEAFDSKKKELAKFIK